MSLLALLATPVLAQEPVPQQLDPRIVAPLVRALQAQIDLQEAQLRALRQDAEARQATLWEWLVAAKQEPSK